MVNPFDIQVRVQGIWNEEKIRESYNGRFKANGLGGMIVKTNNYMFFLTQMEEK
jgi:hypothetical protein